MTPSLALATYQDDQEVLEAQTLARTIADDAHELVVTDPASEAVANELFGRIRTTSKRIVALKTRWLQPFKDQVKLMEADFKEMGRPAAEAEPIVTAKLQAYRREVAEAARKEQQRLRLLAEKRQAAAAAKAEVRGVEPPPVMPIAPTVAPPAKSVKADDGSRTTYVTEYHVEIIDEAAVPREWCCPDAKKLGAAARAQIITPDNCPAGVRVIAEEKPRYFSGR
jgi:hypothetical protein